MAVANVDAHVSAPAVTVTEPGTMVAIMGTSICHIVLGDRPAVVEGMCGVVEDGVVPGLYGFEAGQSAVGDIFAWFVESCVPPEEHEEAERRGLTVHAYLEQEAAKLLPGESGVLALDWWNGNRSVLVDAELGGLLVGMTLPDTCARDLPSADRGDRVRDARDRRRLPLRRGRRSSESSPAGACRSATSCWCRSTPTSPGSSTRSPASKQTPALGAAMFGAVAAGAAAGGYDSIVEASRAMARPSSEVYSPDPDASAVYERLYAEYMRLHDLFGRGGDDVMKNLRHIRASVGARSRGNESEEQ